MLLALKIGQVIVSIILLALILIQSKGVGLGSTFGGGEVYFAKRGAERLLFIFTIIIAIVFIGTSLANVIFN